MPRPIASPSRRSSAIAAVAACCVGASSFASLIQGAPAPARPVVPAAVPPAAPAAPAAPATSAEPWSEQLWNAARTGNRQQVDLLLENVPADATSDAAKRLRESVTRRDEHVAATSKKVAEQRIEKAKEMSDAVAAGNATKALIGAAYMKFLSDDWKVDLASPGVKAAIALADTKIAQARTDGDWLYAEELLNRVRSLYEGSTQKEEFQKYDDALETDVSRRVMLVLEYAPHAWYDMRKKQYERLDEKDRKEPFAPFNEKGDDDWKQTIEGINERILAEALTQIAAQHLENVGWKPLIEGGLSMVHQLSTTPALKEKFPSLGDATLAGAFGQAVTDQLTSVAAMRAEEVDAKTFNKVFAALRAANDATVKLPVEVIVREFGNGTMATITHDFEDPYTEIVWPDRMRRFSQAIKGNFVGVGILIRHNEKREIVIINPLDGSPSKRAGIKPQDKIASVNGMSTADWPLDKAVDTITGPAGTPVTLGITREGEAKPLEYPLVRERIKMYSVQGWKKTGYNERFEPQWDWYVDPEDGIGYIRLTGFNEDTFTDFLKSMREMSTQ
ncbi:MAG: Carboxy-terminal processing protease CtpB precursor, partial [Planctomycetota bacterium]